MPTEIARGVQLYTSSVWQMASVIIRDGWGDILVDPGYFPSELASIAAVSSPTRMILTHADFDHIVGLPVFPATPFVASAAFARRDAKRILKQLSAFDASLYVERTSPLSWRLPDLPIESRTEVNVADEQLVFLPAPGHSEDGLMTVLVGRKVLIAGDYVSELEFPFVEYSSQAYLETLAQIRRLVRDGQVNCAVAGHGPPAMTPEELLTRVQRDEEYILTLRSEAERMVSSGASDRAAGRAMAKIPYRGEHIPAHLTANHTRNVKLVLGEERARPVPVVS